jgi:hypothetical protein
MMSFSTPFCKGYVIVFSVGIHLPSGVEASPTLISPKTYDWLHHQHDTQNSSTNFTPDLTKLMQRYDPRTNSRNQQGSIFKTTNQSALPPSLTSALHACFDTTYEPFASPLNSSMNSNVDYCTALQDDGILGALFDALSYR